MLSVDWVVFIAVLSAMGGAGIMAAVNSRRSGGIKAVQAELESAREAHEAYRRDVAQHFEATAASFKTATSAYVDLHNQLARSAAALCGDLTQGSLLDAPSVCALQQAEKPVARVSDSDAAPQATGTPKTSGTSAPGKPAADESKPTTQGAAQANQPASTDRPKSPPGEAAASPGKAAASPGQASTSAGKTGASAGKTATSADKAAAPAAAPGTSTAASATNTKAGDKTSPARTATGNGREPSAAARAQADAKTAARQQNRGSGPETGQRPTAATGKPTASSGKAAPSDTPAPAGRGDAKASGSGTDGKTTATNGPGDGAIRVPEATAGATPKSAADDATATDEKKDQAPPKLTNRAAG